MVDDPSTIAGRLHPLGFKRYSEYLASPHWQDVKRRYKASANPQMCACGAKPTALHHKTYVRLGKEELTDLEPVCDPCHRKRHGLSADPVKQVRAANRKEQRRRRRKRRREGKFRGATVRHDPSIIREPGPPEEGYAAWHRRTDRSGPSRTPH